MNIDYTKRYWLFAYPEYYPSGGLNDIDSTHDTIKEATERANTPPLDEYSDVLLPCECENTELWDNVERKFVDIELKQL